MERAASSNVTDATLTGRNAVADLNKDENVAVTKSSFNVANVIAAIALLLLVLGLLKFLGVSPI
jgi:hypothetical protein